MRIFYKLLLLTLLCSPTFASPHYSIIIDAGSSGTRLHLFQSDKESNVPIINELFSEDIKPGLSYYADHPENAGASLKKLFDDVFAVINKNQLDAHTIPVDIYATAGMRLLSEKSQNAIYTNVKTYLTQHYTFPLQHVETITGKMEGVYDWLGLNYRENTFATNQSPWGAIDMGGASTQIAFATTDISKPDDEVTLKINNQTYTVFSKSFLGLGQEQARYAMNQDPKAAACYPTGYMTQNSGDINHYNAEDCRSAYQNVITHYDIPNQLSAHDQTQFAVFSGAYYTYTFFGVEDASQGALEARMRNICSMSWEDMKLEYADSGVSEAYLSTYCANGNYLDDLFYGAYHLTGSQMWVTKKSHEGKDIDWALGALLYQLLQ